MRSGGFFYIQCSNCGQLNNVPYGSTYNKPWTREQKLFKVNTNLGVGNFIMVLMTLGTLIKLISTKFNLFSLKNIPVYIMLWFFFSCVIYFRRPKPTNFCPEYETFFSCFTSSWQNTNACLPIPSYHVMFPRRYL